jgi:protocatechuate 3,4-dioxygenase, beta subunit
MAMQSDAHARFTSRRRSLRLLTPLLLVGPAMFSPRVASGQQPSLVPTPSQTEGPFYPKTLPADRDADLTQVAGRPVKALGTVLYFSGRVLARDGRILPGTIVELWQCDNYGRYHHAGDDGVPRDDNFQGYGVATTDAEGRYAFKTIRPVPYTGRPPHMHIRLRHANAPPLTTQLYIAGDVVGADGVLMASPRGTLAKLTMALAPAPGREAGALAGSYEFVLP